MGWKSRGLVAALVLLLGATACSQGSGRPPDLEGEIDIRLSNDPAVCDPLGGERCLLPFPNDYFTVADRLTATGRRVDLDQAATPANASGVHIDPTELNRNDGFSPGSAIAVLLEGLDARASGLAPVTDLARSLDEDAPIVLLDATTGRRRPYWAELDSRAPDDAHRLLFVRPAENLLEGHRYVVAVRDVVDRAGTAIGPSDVFRAYRDRLRTDVAEVEARRPHIEDLFSTLRQAGVGRGDLVLAWDFTVASGRNLSERLLAVRDDAFQQLGDAAPAFTVTASRPSSRANLLREVEGTFEVPSYLTSTGGPGSVLNNGNGPGSSPIPERNGTYTAQFICTVPTSAVEADGTAAPTRLALFGHGLLGSAARGDLYGVSSRFSAATNTTFCATSWIGMSEEDVPTLLAVLGDMSAFRTVPDRLQQSMINFLFLGRLMLHPDGLSADPAFQTADGTPLLDQRSLSFVGVSQGSIVGGALNAVAQDWQRAFLSVPAMNFSTLVDRSIDFDAFAFATVFDRAYPDWVDRQMALVLAQTLWDRGETNGYAQHLTRRPYQGTRAKEVMLLEAFGDHQVANVATEVMARTIDAQLRAPGLADGRSPDVEPFWRIDTTSRFPDRHSSYLVVWDFGTPAPPVENVPNRAGEDPHNWAGRTPPDEVLELATTFLDDGALVDTCGGGPCYTPGAAGTPGGVPGDGGGG
jgi:hypothetical protein